ncbi:MAG: prenyltransferase [Burkholderiales bacterium]|nr:prenyltransferase [Burkholderiales bacterium]
MPALEPTIEGIPNPLLRYLLATRPAFLSVTLFSVLIGLATAYADGVPVHAGTALVTCWFALVAHAGINVLNDYYDALNGTDEANQDRVFPFTGGSRFIQNGVLSRRATALYGTALMLLVIVAGLWLTWVSAANLIWIGAAGLLIGWAYSAPPLKLNSRGLGEVAVWAGFALIAVGSDFVQRGGFSMAPLIAVSSYALLVTNILFINQFPDCKADRAAGKHHLVVRLGVQHARWLYLIVAIAAYGWLTAAVINGDLPSLSLLALAPAPLSLLAANTLLKLAATPRRLGKAIQQTIAAASLHGMLLAATMVVARM